MQTSTWVKAHQDLKNLSGNADAQAQAKGNDAADAEAKAGRALHPAPSKLQADQVKRICWHATVACKTIAATLPLWDRLPRHERVRDEHSRKDATCDGSKEPRHDWVRSREGKHCRKCLLPSQGALPSFKQIRERCRGRADCLSEHATRLGHDLQQT